MSSMMVVKAGQAGLKRDALRQPLQVYTMRETNDELAKLLGGDESNTMGVRTVFAPFAGLQPLQVGPPL